MRSEKCFSGTGTPRGEGGFTLVEILIATIVMVVGLLGILSLFPYSMNNIKETAEFTKATTIASSFHHALLTGVHNPNTRSNVVTIHHSGLYNEGDGMKEKYTFPLPRDPLARLAQSEEEMKNLRAKAAAQGRRIPPTSYWIPCPGQNCLQLTYPKGANVDWGGRGTGSGEAGSYRWSFGENTLAGDTSGTTGTDLEDLIHNIRENFDPTVSLGQYSVGIVIRNRALYPENLYEIIIRVYRTYTRDPNTKIPRSTGGKAHKDLVREYRAKISK